MPLEDLDISTCSVEESWFGRGGSLTPSLPRGGLELVEIEDVYHYAKLAHSTCMVSSGATKQSSITRQEVCISLGLCRDSNLKVDRLFFTFYSKQLNK